MKTAFKILIVIAAVCLVFFFYGKATPKRYIHVSESCVEYSGGGGEMIVMHHILEFDDTEVTITSDNKNTGECDSKTYPYTKHGDSIYIPDPYQTRYKFTEDSLVAADEHTVYKRQRFFNFLN